MVNNYLNFNILDTHSCKTMAILDISQYRDSDNVEGKVLQILPPNDLPLVETNYNQSAITLINSNTLNITKVAQAQYLQDLPDGLYTIKISICPYDKNWAEDKVFRTCQIWCKFYKAFLKAETNSCSSCTGLKVYEQIKKAEEYLLGVEANVRDCNYTDASKNYEVANNLLDRILDCDCGKW